MRRRLAAAAIVVGGIGVALLLIGLADLLGLLSPELTRLLELYLPPFPEGQGGPRWGATVHNAISLAILFGPAILLFWGLAHIHRTEQGRGRVMFWAGVLCVCAVPFEVGLLFIPPLACYVFLSAAPIIRDLGGSQSQPIPVSPASRMGAPR